MPLKETYSSPFDILKISLGNDDEPDELYFSDNDSNSHVIFCNDLLRKINDSGDNKELLQKAPVITRSKENECFYLHVPTRNSVCDFLTSNLHKFEIYEPD